MASQGMAVRLVWPSPSSKQAASERQAKHRPEYPGQAAAHPQQATPAPQSGLSGALKHNNI